MQPGDEVADQRFRSARATRGTQSIHRASFITKNPSSCSQSMRLRGNSSTQRDLSGRNEVRVVHPRPENLRVLCDATGGCVECIGRKQVREWLENGESFVVT